MQKAWMGKFIVVGAVFVLLMLPLGLIDGLVSERAARQQSVTQEIASSSFGRLLVAGPVLSLPYREEYDEWVNDDKEQRPQFRRQERRHADHVARFFPAQQEMNGQVSVSTKSRGIFKARIFEWRGGIDGEFSLDGSFTPQRNRAGSTVTFGKPYLSLVLTDPRALGDRPQFVWDGAPLAPQRGSLLASAPGGVHADIPAFNPAVPMRARFRMGLALSGTDSMAVIPLAGSHQVKLQSNWPHPSFAGQYLPRAYQPGAEGFESQWSVGALSSKSQQQFLQQIGGQINCAADNLCVDRIETRFVEPIDVYSLTDRALKYGFLFIALTFACFILIELLKELRIHPAQYLLVGLALAIFFLLLIGLSEHIPFAAAYTLATLACVALLGFYLHSVLHGGRRGLGFAAMLAALYAALYGLLISEDNALLLGALLVFGVLAAVMVVTRKLDWYALSANTALSEKGLATGFTRP